MAYFDPRTFDERSFDTGASEGVVLEAEGGTFAFTGGDTNFIYSRDVDFEGGTFTFTGGDTDFDLSTANVLNTDGGTFIFTGGDAEFDYSGFVASAQKSGPSKYDRKRRREMANSIVQAYHLENQRLSKEADRLVQSMEDSGDVESLQELSNRLNAVLEQLEIVYAREALRAITKAKTEVPFQGLWKKN